MNVAVLGAGTMGRGIAHVAAFAGHEVQLRDVDSAAVDAAVDTIRENLHGGVVRGKFDEGQASETLARIEGTTDLASALDDVDLVIEAVPEDVDLKRSVFKEVDVVATHDPVLATNTSSLSITEIASSVDAPERVVGLHFFNPPHLMDLVEVVIAEQTDAETEAFAREFVAGVGKEAVVVADVAGFATSRLGVALGLEAVRMLEGGVAPAPAIDRAMSLGYNHPMGPLELTDHVGLDVRLHVAKHLHAELGERFRPPQLLQRKVRAGKLGTKTGEGFYVWEGDERVGPSDN